MSPREKITHESEIEFARGIFNIAISIKEKKIQDYGGLKFYQDGLLGLFFDIKRKFARLDNIIGKRKISNIKEIEINCETVEDTLLDMINYCAIMLQEIEIQKEEMK